VGKSEIRGPKAERRPKSERGLGGINRGGATAAEILEPVIELEYPRGEAQPIFTGCARPH